MNRTYAFAARGLSILNDPKTIATIAHDYAEALWRMQFDQTTPGLSNALDFLRRAPTITGVGQVLGDPTFRAVITTTLGVSQQITPTARERAISSRIDLAQFRDPAFVTQFTHRYLMAARQAVPNLSTLAEPPAGLVI